MKPIMYTCPHCKRHFAPCGGEAHALMCMHAPDMPARVRAALEDPDRPGVALSIRAYSERAPQFAAAGRDALTRAWGPTWADVARRVGLKPGQKSGPMKGTQNAGRRAATENAAIAEVEAALAADADLREQWERRGLPVCGVRQLPDGRMAWMVR